MRCLDGLDHALIAARDLEHTVQQFRALGFQATALGRHQGWATGNHCVMFADDYLELIGRIGDGGLPPAMARALDRGEGLMGLALTSTDPECTYEAWQSQGLEPEQPADLSRRIEGEEGADELRFRNVMLDTSKSGGVPVLACHHLTPDLLKPAALLRHPNGAVGIRSLTIVADDPAPVTAAFRAVFGSAAHSGTDQVSAFQIGDAAIVVASIEDAAVMHPAFTFPETAPEPRPMVLTISVEDVARTAEHLERENIPFETFLDETLAVEPDRAGGVMLEFVPRH